MKAYFSFQVLSFGFLWMIFGSNFALLPPNSVLAADYYVSPNGSGTTCSLASPCNQVTGMGKPFAGDTVYFRGGTYYVTGSSENSTYTGTSSYQGRLQPSRSGTLGSPITYKNYPGETVIIDGTWSTVYRSCRIFGTNGWDYIVFDGFNLIAEGGTRPASIVITGHDAGSQSDNCTVKNCDISGGTLGVNIDNEYWGDNVEGVRIELANDTTVQNCRIYDFKEFTQDGHNTSAIKTYRTLRTIIENCEIYNCSTGVYFKILDSYGIVRYSYLYNIPNQPIYISAGGAGPGNASDISVYHNVISGFRLGPRSIGTGGYRIDRFKFYNNTIYSTTTSDHAVFMSEGTDLEFYNNIIYGANSKQLTFGYANYSILGCDHNSFGSTTIKITTHLYNGDTYYTTLASWQASTELKNNGNPGVGSLDSNPLFVNTSGEYSQLADFELTSESPCKTAGRGGVDMGADITNVGLLLNHGSITVNGGTGSISVSEVATGSIVIQ